MAHVQWPFFMQALQILRSVLRAFQADAVYSVTGFFPYNDGTVSALRTRCKYGSMSFRFCDTSSGMPPLKTRTCRRCIDMVRPCRGGVLCIPGTLICVASPPLPHRERSFAFVFCALATTSFLQVLRTQRLPIDSVATPDTQQQLTANAVTFLKGASRERPHDEQLLASRHTGCCHVGREDTCHATDVEVSDDTVSQSLALGNMRCNCKARGQWKLQAGDA